MKNRSILLLIGLTLATVVGYSADLTDLRESLKGDIVRTVDALVPTSVVEAKAEVLVEINAMRAENSVAALRIDYALDQGAQEWAYQLSDDAFYRHDTNKVSGIFDGEIITVYEGELRPDEIARLFYNSPEHRRILLDPQYQRIGVGIRRWQNVNYVVVRFT